MLLSTRSPVPVTEIPVVVPEGEWLSADTDRGEQIASFVVGAGSKAEAVFEVISGAGRESGSTQSKRSAKDFRVRVLIGELRSGRSAAGTEAHCSLPAGSVCILGLFLRDLSDACEELEAPFGEGSSLHEEGPETAQDGTCIAE